MSRLVLCDLPVLVINRTLQMDLEAGQVVLTSAAQVHAQRRHSNDFARCLPHLEVVISNPLYVGDDFKNDGIELIGRAQALGSMLLVAVNVQPDEDGYYQIVSFYPVRIR